VSGNDAGGLSVGLTYATPGMYEVGVTYDVSAWSKSSRPAVARLRLVHFQTDSLRAEATTPIDFGNPKAGVTTADSRSGRAFVMVLVTSKEAFVEVASWDPVLAINRLCGETVNG